MQISWNRKQISDERFFFHQCREQNRIEYFFLAFSFARFLPLRDALGASYKRTMVKFISQYRKKNESKLRNKQSSKPKEYWKLLNSLNTQSNRNTPNLEEFVEHFKNLNRFVGWLVDS